MDNSAKHIGDLLFGVEKGSEVLQHVRPAAQPLVDNWDCLKSYVSSNLIIWSYFSCFFFVLLSLTSFFHV